VIKWEREVSAHLLAGWIVVAPICGALKWRPHIWITGGAGTGKSWVMRNVVRKLLGNAGLAVQGETTEAGIRQYLGTDARPIVFDEAEGEDKRALDRIQTVLSLMRGASTDDGGSIIKGSAGGKSQEFTIRSCFAFASIGMSVSQQSDRSRITILDIKGEPNKTTAENDWKELQRLHLMLTDEYCASLRARTIMLLPTIIKNAEVFSEAAALELGSQRLGDQLGALLAGSYSLHSQSVITLPVALAWIRERSLQWNEERGLDQTKDEMQLLGKLLETEVRVEPAHSSAVSRTISELVLLACYDKTDDRIPHDEAHDRLRRLGMKIEGEYLIISNSAEPLKNILQYTSWARNWGKVLKRVEGSQEYPGERFTSGIMSRAVGIPLKLIRTE